MGLFPGFHPGYRGSKPLGDATFFLNRYNRLQHSSRFTQGLQRLKIGFYANLFFLRHKKRSPEAPLFTRSRMSKLVRVALRAYFACSASEKELPNDESAMYRLGTFGSFKFT